MYINFRRSKLGKNGLKSKNARKETPIIFQFYVRNMSGMLVMVNWEASYRGGEKKQLKIFHMESFDSLTLDASNSVKTGSNKKMQEKRPQLFLNFTLETCLTRWSW